MALRMTFHGTQAARNMAGQFRTMAQSADFDAAMTKILVATAEQDLLIIKAATPVRSGDTQRSWKIRPLGKNTVAIFTTRPQTVHDLLDGTPDVILPEKKKGLAWHGTGSWEGTYYVRRWVHGQKPNIPLNAAVTEIRTRGIDSAVANNAISRAVGEARLGGPLEELG